MKTVQLKNKNEIIGKRIFDMRYNAYFSQVEFAHKLQVCGLDIDTVTLLKIEKGKRYLLAVELPFFAKALNMPLDDFTKKLFEN